MKIENRDPNIYDENDYTPRVRLEKDADDTGDPIPATGIADLDLWISATENGAMIHSTLKVRAVELTKKPGTYKATINGSDIHTQMFGAGAQNHTGDVWVVIKNVAGNVRGSERVKAIGPRRIS